MESSQSEMSMMKIAQLAFDGISMFHLSAPGLVFNEVARQGWAPWRTVVLGLDGSSIRTAEGYVVSELSGIDEIAAADLVVVPSWFEDLRPADDDLLGLLRDAHERGATVVGLCLGALPVAQSGLLNGRRAVTHWRALEALAAMAPEVTIDGSVLYIDHGDVLTSAGTASGLDACLHLVRARLGASAANEVARALVVAPHRSGGQAQFVHTPIPEMESNDPLASTMAWALAHLSASLSVDDLAQRALMSRRTFVRTFKESTGTTPAAWVRQHRLDLARRLLEQTDDTIESVAHRAGFASAITMRQNFAATFRISPQEYRRGFSKVQGS